MPLSFSPKKDVDIAPGTANSLKVPPFSMNASVTPPVTSVPAIQPKLLIAVVVVLVAPGTSNSENVSVLLFSV